jgi:aerobic-type carbon monoxide dehydrogenase small subunit (CoxS/CutS family)
MAEIPEEINNEKSHISRRQFLKDAGLIVGGATVGSMALVNACGGTTVTAPGVTSTKTVTTTVQGPGGATVTTTVTAPGQGGATVTATKTVTTTATGGPAAMAANVVTLNVNGQDYVMKVEPEWTLAFVLRKKLGLTGTKVSCDRGECGLCSVLADGKLVLSCCMPAIECEGVKVVTIEGLQDGPNLHPVQKQFLDDCIFQCGYCTPAMILATVALYAKTPSPSVAQAQEAISGNLCWCGDQARIIGCITKKPIRAKRGVA